MYEVCNMKVFSLFLMLVLMSSLSLQAQRAASIESDNSAIEFNIPAESVDRLIIEDGRISDKEGKILSKRELIDLLIKESTKANSLETQLFSLGIQPQVSVPELPTNLARKRTNELTEMIIQYNNISKRLYDQLATTEKPTLIRLKFLLDSTQNEISKVVYQSELEKLRIYEEQRKKFKNYYEKLKEEKLDELFKNSTQVFNASLIGRQFFLPGSGVTGDFSLGAKFELSLYPIFNSADFIEIYGEFMKPNFYTKDAQNYDYAWNINSFATGLNIKIPGRLDLDYFTVGMRLSGGYYWSEARQYNSGIDKSDWRGYNLAFELDMMKYTWFYPLDVFIQYSLFYPTVDFAFNTPDGRLNLGKGMFSGLSAGIRLCLWWQDKY